MCFILKSHISHLIAFPYWLHIAYKNACLKGFMNKKRGLMNFL